MVMYVAAARLCAVTNKTRQTALHVPSRGVHKRVVSSDKRVNLSAGWRR